MAGSIKNMHFDFKRKLNAIDTATYRGFNVPTIDRFLNEGLQLWILLVAEPRLRNQMGVEMGQRAIDDLNPLIKDSESLTLAAKVNGSYSATLPTDYLYYLSTDSLIATKGNCSEQKLKTIVVQHDDRSEDRSFYNSNFEWRECNIRFYSSMIKVFADDFTVDSFAINYIKKHEYIHNAEGAEGGNYNLPDGTSLTGYNDCILPEIVHSEVVDLSVLLATGDLELPLAYQLKYNTLKLKQLVTN